MMVNQSNNNPMNIIIIIGLLIVTFVPGLSLMALTAWTLYQNAKQYNKEHDLP